MHVQCSYETIAPSIRTSRTYTLYVHCAMCIVICRVNRIDMKTISKEICVRKEEPYSKA